MLRITHLSRFSQKAKGLPKTCSKQFTKRSSSSSSSSTKNATANKSKIEKIPNDSGQKNVPVKSFAIGTIAGITGSLVGLGGGFLMIPAMTAPSFLALSQHVAHGTSLFAVTTTGIAGGLSYGQNGNVDFYAAGAIALSGMVTARLGAKYSNRLSQKQLKKVLGSFMIMAAPIVPLRPYLESWKDGHSNKKNEDEHSNQVDWKVVGVSSCIGLFSGFMAGLLGVGGGAVVVPCLTLFTPMDHYTALGTSLTAMGLPAMAGTITHFQNKNVNLRVAPFLALGSLFGAYSGGKFALQVDENVLRTGFSGMMVTLGIRTILKA